MENATTSNSGENSRLYIVSRMTPEGLRILKCSWCNLSDEERTFQLEAERRALMIILFNPCGLY
jgi:hypothetical protein